MPADERWLDVSHVVGLHPGATWRRVDLQCHSPRDLRWVTSGPFPGGTPEHEKARAAWADEFVKAAIDRGLSIVAITDHHDTVFLPYVLEAAKRAGSALTVLPGIEVTCHDNVQCLAIFEPGSEPGDWQRLLHKLTTITPNAPDEPRNANPQECGLTVQQLFAAVAADTVLLQKVIIIPHFGNVEAHKSLNDEGFAARAKALDCDAVYIECPYSDLHPTTLQKIRGEIADWGTRRRAILATGDNRHASWNRVGAHECWVRLGEVTLEGFRQAFLADEARIAYAKPETPSERIVEIEILSSLTGPDPLRISFNESFSALIGGRGSGKSSILEYLRFGLGKSEADLYHDAGGKRPREREARLIEDTLSEGHVKLKLQRGGVNETWERKGSKTDEIVVTQDGAAPHVLTIDAAQKRFPARAFHQKELSTTMVDGAAAADNITGIAAAEIIEERRRNERDIAAAKREVSVTLQQLSAHWQAELQLTEARNATEDVRRRRLAVSDELQKGGVSDGDLQVLADASRYGRAENYLDEVLRRLEADATRIKAAGENLLAIDATRFADALGFPELQKLNEQSNEARARVADLLKAAAIELDGLKSARDEALKAFAIANNEFKGRYDEAKQRQTAHAALIVDNERLAGEEKLAAATEDEAAALVTTTASAVTTFSDARAKLTQLVEERFDLLKKAADEVAGKSAGALKARAKRDRVPSEFVSALCQILEGSRVRDPDVQCQEWLADAFKDDFAAGWAAICGGLLAIHKAKIMGGNPAEPGPSLSAEIKRIMLPSREPPLTQMAINRIFEKVNDQTLGVLLGAVPKDSIVLTYVSGRQDIPFEKASPGQQASALLRLLLQQEAGTLIIDQPEDDLDNRVLMEIVDQIRRSKGRRQLIFATHNPNLVVNGDADKVVGMSATVAEDRPTEGSAMVSVFVDGAIETPAVRNAITGIMEGGLQAFDLRARKYGVEGAAR